jgi:hypothetical protein
VLYSTACGRRNPAGSAMTGGMSLVLMAINLVALSDGGREDH